MEDNNNSIGVFQQAFENIRAKVYSDLQEAGARYVMTVQQTVKTCISANMQISELAKLHAKQMTERFKSCNAQLVNFTNSNAMISIDGQLILLSFDLNMPGHSISSAKFMHPQEFTSQLGISSHLLAVKVLQTLMLDSIDDTHIVVPYQQLKNAIFDAKKQLQDTKTLLHETIKCRAFTAFDFDKDMTFYTLNYSDNMDMLFWDRYTITASTAKSYYVEQHCIVEHTITGDVEPERFIMLHKPSKNSMAMFLADRLACLSNLVCPAPNVALTEHSAQVLPTTEQDANAYVDDDDDADIDSDASDKYTRAELEAMGINPNDVDPSNILD